MEGADRPSPIRCATEVKGRRACWRPEGPALELPKPPRTMTSPLGSSTAMCESRPSARGAVSNIPRWMGRRPAHQGGSPRVLASTRIHVTPATRTEPSERSVYLADPRRHHLARGSPGPGRRVEQPADGDWVTDDPAGHQDPAVGQCGMAGCVRSPLKAGVQVLLRGS